MKKVQITLHLIAYKNDFWSFIESDKKVYKTYVFTCKDDQSLIMSLIQKYKFCLREEYNYNLDENILSNYEKYPITKW